MSTRTGTALVTRKPGQSDESMGTMLSAEALAELGADAPPILAALAFVSTQLLTPAFLSAMRARLGGVPILGCTTAGEFRGPTVSDEGATLMLIASDTMKVSLGLGTNLRKNSQASVTQVFSQLRAVRGNATREYAHRTLLVLSDGLAGNGEELVDRLALEAGPRCAIVGGAAGDGGRFQQTTVFLNDQVQQDALVVAEFLSQTPFGVGVAHGWCPTKFERKVTRVEGNRVVELDNRPAIELYQEYARAEGVTLAPQDVNWFMMTHELGIQMPNREIKVRAPLSSTENGSIVCATEIPLGKTVSIVEGRKQDLLAAARLATERAIIALAGSSPAGVIVFDCVARKANLSNDFIEEVEAIRGASGNVPIIGFNTYGEIAKVKGQLSGFHNTTDVVLVVPST